jgi:hypothetical protein
MTMAKQFQQQFGGLYTAVIPYEQADPLHRSSLGGVLRDAIKHEAKVHGAAFDHAGFRNVMQAMANGDVEVLFFAAAWDVCEPKIIGATINDTLLGGLGADKAYGGEGNDVFWAGGDEITAGEIIDGGAGDNSLVSWDAKLQTASLLNIQNGA